MAAGAKCKLRYDGGHKTMRQLRIRNRSFHRFLKEETNNQYGNIHKFELYYAGTFSNGYAEISAPNAVFDGTATPIVVYAISASASDTAVGGAGHAEKVKIIGITSLDKFHVEEVSLAGQVQVATTTLWKRIFHAYVSEWGSGGTDAAGNITITNTGQTATYLTIAATFNESDGSAIFIPDTFKANLDHIELTMTSSANANASILTKYSRTGFGNGADPDFDYREVRTNINSGGAHETDDDIYTAVSEGKITFSETYKGNAEDGYLKYEIIVWE